MTQSARANALNDGEVHSSNHEERALLHGRWRQFGGTANLWGYRTVGDDGRRRARMLVPQDIDFEDRGLTSSGAWPMPRTALDPYYERARHVLELGSPAFELEKRTSADQPLQLEGSRLVNTICYHAAGDVFTNKGLHALQAEPTIGVVLNATVSQLETNQAGSRVETATILRPDGSHLRVAARAFVLAAGGIENPRLLLLSTTDNGGGLHNEHGVMGRYLMDHPEFDIGTLHPSSDVTFERMSFYDLRWDKGSLVGGNLGFSEDTIREEGLLNMSFTLVGHRSGFGSTSHNSLRAAADAGWRRPGPLLKNAIVAAAHPFESAQVIRNRVLKPYTEFSGGWSRDPKVHSLRLFEVYTSCEQSPDPTNRITLTDRRDDLGLRRAHVRWEWSNADRDRIARAQDILNRELSHLGVFRPLWSLGEALDPRWQGIHHPMGTTRMHTDPAVGVIDADCRVHGTSNLYVTGASVFPTSLGYSNPTFTIVALAIRLADHLRDHI